MDIKKKYIGRLKQNGKVEEAAQATVPSHSRVGNGVTDAATGSLNAPEKAAHDYVDLSSVPLKKRKLKILQAMMMASSSSEKKEENQQSTQVEKSDSINIPPGKELKSVADEHIEEASGPTIHNNVSEEKPLKQQEEEQYVEILEDRGEWEEGRFKEKLKVEEITKPSGDLVKENHLNVYSVEDTKIDEIKKKEATSELEHRKREEENESTSIVGDGSCKVQSAAVEKSNISVRNNEESHVFRGREIAEETEVLEERDEAKSEQPLEIRVENPSHHIGKSKEENVENFLRDSEFDVKRTRKDAEISDKSKEEKGEKAEAFQKLPQSDLDILDLSPRMAEMEIEGSSEKDLKESGLKFAPEEAMEFEEGMLGFSETEEIYGKWSSPVEGDDSTIKNLHRSMSRDGRDSLGRVSRELEEGRDDFNGAQPYGGDFLAFKRSFSSPGFGRGRMAFAPQAPHGFGRGFGFRGGFRGGYRGRFGGRRGGFGRFGSFSGPNSTGFREEMYREPYRIERLHAPAQHSVPSRYDLQVNNWRESAHYGSVRQPPQDFSVVPSRLDSERSRSRSPREHEQSRRYGVDEFVHHGTREYPSRRDRSPPPEYIRSREYAERSENYGVLPLRRFEPRREIQMDLDSLWHTGRRRDRIETALPVRSSSRPAPNINGSVLTDQRDIELLKSVKESDDTSKKN